MNVFLSYSHSDKEIVRKIANDLKNYKINVLMDETVVSPGEDWAEKLNQAILNSDAVIIVMSRETNVSKWQISEISFAISAQKNNHIKRIIPVLIQKGAEVPFFLKSLVYCDLSDEDAYNRNFSQLIQALDKLHNEPTQSLDSDRFRIESLKAERSLLIQEKKALNQKKVFWTTSVISAIASITALILTLLTGVLVNFGLNGHKIVAFLIGVVSGILASLLANAASKIFFHKSSNRMEGTNAK